MLKDKIRAWLLLAGVALMSAAPLFAHHSMSMYDLDHTITREGKVTEFDWSNPHAKVYFEVKDPSGNTVRWTADCPGPNRLAHAGWTKDSIKPEDEVTIVGNQAKDGSNTMRLGRLVFADGQELRGYIR